MFQHIRETHREKIDKLAVACCIPMSEGEKQRFISDLKTPQLVRKFGYVVRHKERPLYRLDGKKYNELWDTIDSFISRVVGRFYRIHSHWGQYDLGDYWDIFYGLKEYVTLYLMVYGGNNYNTPFSGMLVALIVHYFSTLLRVHKAKKRYAGKNLVSLDELREQRYDHKDRNLVVDQEADISFWSSIPNRNRALVIKICGNDTKKSIAESLGTTENQLKRFLRKEFSYLKG